MSLKLIFDEKTKKLTAEEPETVGSLDHGCYGKHNKAILELIPEEALYLMDIRNATCSTPSNSDVTFNDIAESFSVDLPKLMARFFTYKGWRDRGLIVKPIIDMDASYGTSPLKKYPKGHFSPPKYNLKGMFYPEDLVTTIDNEEIGKELYEKFWIGQFGTYKAKNRGRLSNLDVYETVFMLKHMGLKLRNAALKDVVKHAKAHRPDFELMYEVYEDWRIRNYVVKTGFKFGTHFRLYFPGASPTLANEEWLHSKHVIHVFPRTTKMLISEWSRAIRVAHSVRKTFILAIPGKKRKAKCDLDFLLYHRKSGAIENPREDKPKFVMLSLSEEEYIGGDELASAIEQAKKMGLKLILAIADRETSITYYQVRALQLPGSDYEYYEITWEQP